MNRAPRSALALFFALSLVASLVAPSGLANAASIYDSSYQSTATARTSWSHLNCDPVDITLDWKSYLLDETKWPPGSDFSAARTSLQSALSNENGAWGVAQFTTEIANVVQVYWTEDPTAHLSWSSQGVDAVAASEENSYSVDIACSNKFYNTGSPAPVVISVAPFQSFKISTSPTWTMFYRMKSLFVHGFDLNYPADYEGTPVRTDQPVAKYVAMGDSFSSGEGNPVFDPATDRDGMNECHRSHEAYPHLLQNDSSLNLGPTVFVACAGATTNDVLGLPEGNDPIGKWDEPAQIDALSESTEVATITIGGNDAGFDDFATECLYPVNPFRGVCDEFTDIYETTEWKINNELPDKLQNVFGTLLSEAQNATIYVLGYPNIAPYKYIGEPFDQRCGGLYDEIPNNWGGCTRCLYDH